MHVYPSKSNMIFDDKRWDRMEAEGKKLKHYLVDEPAHPQPQRRGAADLIFKLFMQVRPRPTRPARAEFCFCFNG
jgi:hypothetical protein